MTRTEIKLAREVAILDTYGEALSEYWQYIGETRAEFGMSWVCGGGHASDASAAWRQFGARPTPAWVLVVEAAADKALRRRHRRAEVIADDDGVGW